MTLPPPTDAECRACLRDQAAVLAHAREPVVTILADLIAELNVTWDTDPMQVRAAKDRAAARLLEVTK
jgi:hypothetical protein